MKIFQVYSKCLRPDCRIRNAWPEFHVQLDVRQPQIKSRFIILPSSLTASPLKSEFVYIRCVKQTDLLGKSTHFNMPCGRVLVVQNVHVRHARHVRLPL